MKTRKKLLGMMLSGFFLFAVVATAGAAASFEVNGKKEYVAMVSVSDRGEAAVLLPRHDGEPGSMIVADQRGAIRRVGLDLSANFARHLEKGSLALSGGREGRYVFELWSSDGSRRLWSSADFRGLIGDLATVRFSEDGESWFSVEAKRDFRGFTIHSGNISGGNPDSFAFNTDALRAEWEKWKPEFEEDAPKQRASVWASTFEFQEPGMERWFVLHSSGKTKRLAIQYGGQVYIASTRSGQGGWGVRSLRPLAFPSSLNLLDYDPATGDLELVDMVDRLTFEEKTVSAASDYREISSSPEGAKRRERKRELLGNKMRVFSGLNSKRDIAVSLDLVGDNSYQIVWH